MMWREELRSVVEKMPERRVLVQIPEGLKVHLDEILEIFQEYGKEAIVDLDPVYGACDIRINEMRAVGAETIVHIGHRKMLDIPGVYYVEYPRDVDVDAVIQSIREISGDRKACFATTANFSWILERVKGIPSIVVGKGSWRVPGEGIVLGCDTTACDVEADLNIFLGDGRFHPMAIWINTQRPTYVVLPNGEHREVSFESVLKRRLTLVGSLDGRRVGVIVSSKLGQNRWKLAQQLKDLAERRGYIVRLYVSDYLEPSYLLGLEEDFYVYTGCPRVPIDDSERYEKPLLTPEEFLLKLGLMKEYRIGWITEISR